MTSKLEYRNRGEKGTGHWRWQRITALLLIPLSLWLAPNFAIVIYGSYAEARAWIFVPINCSLLILTLAILLFHAHLGLKIVIEDYLDGLSRKLLIRTSGIVSSLGCLLSVSAVLSMYFLN